MKPLLFGAQDSATSAVAGSAATLATLALLRKRGLKKPRAAPGKLTKAAPAPPAKPTPRKPPKPDPEGDAARAQHFRRFKQAKREADFRSKRQAAGQRIVRATERREGDRPIFDRKPKGQAWERPRGRHREPDQLSQPHTMNPIRTRIQQLAAATGDYLTQLAEEDPRKTAAGKLLKHMKR